MSAVHSQELLRSWHRCWGGIGARGDDAGLFDQLIARHSEPHRAYHTVQHLGECIALFESSADLAQHPAEVEMGLWFHDAIYEVRAHDNEARSAAWAQAALRD